MTFLINVLLGLSTLFCVGMNDPAKNPGEFQNYVLNQVNPDCYYNWAIYDESNLKNSKFDPMLFRVNDGNIAQAVKLAKQYPGRTWLIYNEPEGIDQSNTSPETAAIWFDKVYTAIKAVDPTSTIACCGVMIRTEGINWLDTFVKNVKHKPDVCHIHVYTPKATFEAWKQYVDYWWYWNDKNGNLPTYITETCAMSEPSQSVFQYRQEFFPPTKLTPQPEPTKKPTEEATKTPEPTKTPQPTVTPTPTYWYQIFMPIVNK